MEEKEHKVVKKIVMMGSEISSPPALAFDVLRALEKGKSASLIYKPLIPKWFWIACCFTLAALIFLLDKLQIPLGSTSLQIGKSIDQYTRMMSSIDPVFIFATLAFGLSMWVIVAMNKKYSLH